MMIDRTLDRVAGVGVDPRRRVDRRAKAVEKLAAAELRSVNAQIECLVREALNARAKRDS